VASYSPAVFTSQIAVRESAIGTGASCGQTTLATPLPACGDPGSVWFPDLRRGQFAVIAGGAVKIPDWCIRDR
jgi:hypothetical protein